MEVKKVDLPLDDEKIKDLKAGDNVLLSGVILTARDAAHKRLYELMINNKELPVDIKNQVIYYVGPSDTPPGKVIGSAGPTSSYRMDKYTPKFLKSGLKGMIGKGDRSKEVKQSIISNGAVYFMAIGGAGALLAKSIIKQEIVCYEDLQTEAVRKYVVKDFPVVVAIDCYGNNIYEIEENEL
ncbi:MAG: Fe-S-containing hydro-lyase [Clostridia bacterium]|nr:Fe-S-containing hydro-lyase [Clostridia bacterium]